MAPATDDSLSLSLKMFPAEIRLKTLPVGLVGYGVYAAQEALHLSASHAVGGIADVHYVVEKWKHLD